MLAAAVAVIWFLFGRFGFLKIGRFYKFLPPQQAEHVSYFRVFTRVRPPFSVPTRSKIVDFSSIRLISIVSEQQNALSTAQAQPPDGCVAKLNGDDTGHPFLWSFKGAFVLQLFLQGVGGLTTNTRTIAVSS